MKGSSKIVGCASFILLAFVSNSVFTSHSLAQEAQSDLDAAMLKVKNLSEQSQLAYDIVKSLTVEVGPRIAGSKADKRAVAWAEAKLNELGFDKVYTQPVKVRNWERGFADAKVIAPYQQNLVITALGGSVATPSEGIVSSVVMFSSLDELKASTQEQVKDKIVFLNTRMQRHKAGKFYGKVVPNRVNGAVEAAKLGAKAVVIRSVGTDNSRFAHTGLMRYSEEVKKIPAGAISTSDADTLEAIFESNKDVVLDIKMQAKEAGWQTSYNVIGEFTGSTYPDEVVLISGHLDSWDTGTGALDDGAGVAIATAAAKLVKDAYGQPQRTIRVVLYAAEEIGLVGARQYATHNKDSLHQIIAAAESDFGAGPIYRLDTRFKESELGIVAPLFKALSSLGIEPGSNDTNGGPDVSVLPQHGVPVFALKQDGTYYFDYHHTPNDTLDKIDLKAITQNQTAWAITTLFLANSRFDPRPAP